MATRYHYDRNGRYKGKSTDKPPGDDLLGFVIVMFLFILFIGGCLKGC